MSKRALSLSLLTAGLSAGLIAGAISPAAAQGTPVGGDGNVYFLSGALNISGQAQEINVFGNVNDVVYYGDWDGDGDDEPMVRRGNIYYIQTGSTTKVFVYGDVNDEVLVGNWDGKGADLNADGDMVDAGEATAETDTLAVRRGNQFFVKNNNLTSGKADWEFFYGNAGDTVLVGNWDGKLTAATAGVDNNSDGDFVDAGTPAYAADKPQAIPRGAVDLNADGDTADAGEAAIVGDAGFDANSNGSYADAGDRAPGTGVDNNGDGDFTDAASPAVPADVPAKPGKADTVMIQRGNQFFVKNSLSTGVADYTFIFGNAGDEILVGDWATAPTARQGATLAKPALSANGADQLAVRRGFTYYQSSELDEARVKKTNPSTQRVFAFGNPDDTVFVASLSSPAVDANGDAAVDDPATASVDESATITGDGLGVRR